MRFYFVVQSREDGAEGIHSPRFAAVDAASVDAARDAVITGAQNAGYQTWGMTRVDTLRPGLEPLPMSGVCQACGVPDGKCVCSGWDKRHGKVGA